MNKCSIKELAELVAGSIVGDPDTIVDGVGSLKDAKAGEITFLNNDRFQRDLLATRASAVILSEKYIDDCPVNAIVVADPYLAYARIATRLSEKPRPPGGIHPSAIIHPDATIDSTAIIGPNVIIEANSIVARGVMIGAGCVIGASVAIGLDGLLFPNVTLYTGVQIGKRCRVHSGAVIGSDGFGFASDAGQWVRIPQLGTVVIGDDVDIGANTTIDRGAIENTEIGNNVIIDNLVQIAHNVKIGDHTAIAAMVGIAGSTVIGKHCTFGGQSGINGHIEICDNVFLSGMSMVTRSIQEPGAYGSGLPAAPVKEWRRSVARFRQLDQKEKEREQRVRQLEELYGKE